MILKEFDLDNYLFGTGKKDLLPREKKRIKQALKKEMYEIFSGRNIANV
jgi:S-adenosylmethionine decarboxylase